MVSAVRSAVSAAQVVAQPAAYHATIVATYEPTCCSAVKRTFTATEQTAICAANNAAYDGTQFTTKHYTN